MGYAVIVVLFLLVLAGAYFVRQKAGAARARLEDALGRLDVLRQEKATCHGIASKGEGQARALGVLALTPDELVFLEFVTEGELRVPRAAITAVEVTRGFLGKVFNADVLVVRWTSDDRTSDDEADGAAFEVAEVEEWRSALQPTA